MQAGDKTSIRRTIRELSRYLSEDSDARRALRRPRLLRHLRDVEDMVLRHDRAAEQGSSDSEDSLDDAAHDEAAVPGEEEHVGSEAGSDNGEAEDSEDYETLDDYLDSLDWQAVPLTCEDCSACQESWERSSVTIICYKTGTEGQMSCKVVCADCDEGEDRQLWAMPWEMERAEDAGGLIYRLRPGECWKS